MDKKKIILLFTLSVLCFTCILFEAYRKGYIKTDIDVQNDVKGNEDNDAKKALSDNLAQDTNNDTNEDTDSDNDNGSNEDDSNNGDGDKGINKEDSNKNDDDKKDKNNERPKPEDSEDVRVLIMTNGFSGYYHDSVCVTCGQDFIVESDGKSKTYKAGKKITYKMNKETKKKKYTIRSTGKARIKLLSVKRQGISPLYRGSIEVKWDKKGFLITNELPLEYYLYAVVPSEMSTGNKMEALKAQAVCARSYAYNQLRSDRYKEYKADLDDSVSCQVYNNIPEDERSRKAVNATCGEIMVNGKNIVLAYYYSTSWGVTAEGQDVWDTEKRISYLKSAVQTVGEEDNKEIDLSDDNKFREFIDNKEHDTYDSDSEWYRWSVTLNVQKLSERIDSALYSCYLADKSAVLAQDEDGSYSSKPLKSVGKIKKLRIENRTKSGLVTELVVVGDKNVVKVCTQYNIRKVLAPVYEKIYRSGADIISSYSMLPSAAFYIDDIKNSKGAAFKIKGGGFGHGAGMSQSGACTMAKKGFEYDEILKHYFNGVKVKLASFLKK